MATGMLAAYHALAAFCATDFCEDLKAITVPRLVVHGGDDQIVPIEISEKLTAGLVRNARLIGYEGRSNGLIITQKDRLNADLLAFLKA